MDIKEKVFQSAKTRDEKLKQITNYDNDEYYVKVLDIIATNQDELDEILNLKENTVFLFGKEFYISYDCKNVNLIGINNPKIFYDVGKENYAFETTGVTFENVEIEVINTYKLINKESLEMIRKLKKDCFESNKDYEERIEKICRVYCGNILLNKNNYFAEDEIFEVQIKCFNCLKKIMICDFENKKYRIYIRGDKAKELFDSGVYKPIFIDFIVENGKLKINKIFTIFNDEIYYLLQIDDFTNSGGLLGYGIYLI